MQDIYTTEKGKGHPLVLIHGFLGSSIMWEPQINYFKDYFRVISPDLPGFGKSNKAKSYNDIKSIANLILNFLEKRKINKFHLLGHSMGGMVVQEMSKISGDKISKLICYSTGSIGKMPERFETIEESRQRFKDIGYKKTAYSIAETWFVQGNKSKYFYLCSESGKEANHEAIDNALIAMKNWNGKKNLKNINNQTLIIWGDKDRSYNFNQIDILKRNIPNSSLKIFKDCAHNVHLEKPIEFNECVKNFLV